MDARIVESNNALPLLGTKQGVGGSNEAGRNPKLLSAYRYLTR
jgi:hypothetical protein